ncbi:MAG TPA: PHP-associated domain-containing protein [Vicinamibacterales bacterium]|nr:PHP-associated domain-containing protein [Vicinamibacterales bacterium]
MLKVELHAHTDADPEDRIPHTTAELIERAASLGYNALAVTLHDRYFDPAEWEPYARARGLVLLPGIERTIGHRHVLLINFPPDCAHVRSFAEIAELKAAAGGLVIAPHPFYPVRSALRSWMDRHATIIDAVEFNAMYTRALDFNRRAAAWARKHDKPLVGNTDLHRLRQMGTTYSLIDARPDPGAICAAIRAGKVELRTEPLSPLRAGRIYCGMVAGGLEGKVRRMLRR